MNMPGLRVSTPKAPTLPPVHPDNPTGDPTQNDLYAPQLPPAGALGVDGNDEPEVEDTIAHGKASDGHHTL